MVNHIVYVSHDLFLKHVKIKQCYVGQKSTSIRIIFYVSHLEFLGWLYETFKEISSIDVLSLTKLQTYNNVKTCKNTKLDCW